MGPRRRDEAVGWERRSRTSTTGSRAPRPTIRRSPNPRAVYDGPFGAVKKTAALEPVAQTRIEAVAQAVAHDVDRQHRRGQENPREEDVVGEDAEERAPLGHDIAPGRRLRRDSDPQEGQDGLDHDGRGADESRLDDDR